ncbi:hypothetical protein ABPG75_001607 [Micractinium tetrahymenae]
MEELGLQDEGSAPPTLLDLPDQLLGAILSLADTTSTHKGGAALTRVCLRFRSIYWAEPSVWGTLRIEAAALDFLPARRQVAWLAGKRALLQRVSPVVSALAVHDRAGALAIAARSMELGAAARVSSASAGTAPAGAGAGGTASSAPAAAATGAMARGNGCRLEDLLCLLHPGIAREVELEVHPALPEAALAALPRLGCQLTALNLDTRQLPPGTAAVLRRLRALHALRLGAAHVDAAAAAACAALRHLSRLELEASFFALPDLSPLAACASLAALRLVDDSQRREPLLLPPPASFRGGQGLLSLTVYTRALCQVAEARLGFVCLSCAQPATGEGPAWASLSLDGRRRAAGSRLQPLSSLPALLAATLPAGVPLRCLCLHGCQLAAADVTGCCAWLADVETFKAEGCTDERPGGFDSSNAGAGAVGFTVVLEPLLQAMPALRKLELAACLAGKVPPWLAAKRGLRKLALPDNGLSDLPADPFLSTGVTELDLSRNSFARLPPALLAASDLESLLLPGCAQLVLAAEEAEQLLQVLPRLRTVDLTGTAIAADVVERLQRGLAR